MDKARSYTILKKELDEEKFKNFAKKITESYVNSELEYSQTQVAEDNNITVSCVRKLMDYAITEAIVSRKTAEEVEVKSIANQQRKHSEAGGSSIRHHKQLMEQRNTNIAKKMTVKEVEEIIKAAIARGDQFEEILSIYKKIETKRALYLVFERAVSNIIVSDEDAETIMALIMKKYPVQKAVDFCNRLKRQRNEIVEILS